MKYSGKGEEYCLFLSKLSLLISEIYTVGSKLFHIKEIFNPLHGVGRSDIDSRRKFCRYGCDNLFRKSDVYKKRLLWCVQ